MTKPTQLQAIDVKSWNSNFDDQDIGIGTLCGQIDKSPSSQSLFHEYRPVTTGDIETATGDSKKYTFSVRYDECYLILTSNQAEGCIHTSPMRAFQLTHL